MDSKVTVTGSEGSGFMAMENYQIRGNSQIR